MTRAGDAALSGRRAQAAKNDDAILVAAREVFAADSDAPIAAVAQRAGVGISALYRRYRSKEDLLQQLALDGLQRYLEEVESALAEKATAWVAFVRFMERALDAGAGSITARFAGDFPTTNEMHNLGRQAAELTTRLIEKVKRTGDLREDIEVGDLSLLFEQLQSIESGSTNRTRQLRRRYLALVLEALHRPGRSALPGPAPRWGEISARYRAPATSESQSHRRAPLHQGKEQHRERN